MENTDEKAAMLALNHIFGFNPRCGKALLDSFPDARSVFYADRSRLRTVTGPNADYLDRLVPGTLDQAREELQHLLETGAGFAGFNESGYPALLKECPDPPLGLYYKSSGGSAVFREDRLHIGIVGTRDMSSYGREWCSLIVRALSRIRPVPAIVSGLAFGIDFTAHVSALDAGMPTIAVMATGIDEVYPYRHIPLAKRIESTPSSALVTDYPEGTVPKPVHFLRRNRIIAGMCDAVVLVESKEKGGGMITARLAADYDRDVYALPGRADDIRSRGCNILIRERVAEAVTDPDDLVKRLGFEGCGTLHRKTVGELLSEYYSGLPEDEFAMLLDVAEAVKDHRGAGIDEIARICGADAAAVSQAAGILETDGIIFTDLLRRCSFNSKLL